MKLPKLPDDEMQQQPSDKLQEVLLNRVIKLRKLSKEMKDSVQVQKAQEALEVAKQPFKKARLKWLAEVEAIERELRSRDIKFNIKWDDIYEELEL